MTPIYEADEHVKTQLRKQVRAEAGVTMRKVQAEAKRKRDTADGSSSLIATGLAARPPEGLDEVKAIAQAAREAHREVVSNEHEQVERLQRVSLEEWRKERQRIREHQASFTDDRRFRRQSQVPGGTRSAGSKDCQSVTTTA